MEHEPHPLIDTEEQKAGRNEIPVAVALKVQRELMDRMIPEAVKPYMQSAESDTDTDDPIRQGLYMRFAEKYLLNFNGFAEYCNNRSNDREFMERAKLGQCGEEDLNDMVRFFEASEKGGPFFQGDTAVVEFIRQYNSDL